jgi:hypothetical protein
MRKSIQTIEAPTTIVDAPPHRLDEFPAGYSLTGCSPALPVSASPVGVDNTSGQHQLRGYRLNNERNCSVEPLTSNWKAANSCATKSGHLHVLRTGRHCRLVVTSSLSSHRHCRHIVTSTFLNLFRKPEAGEVGSTSVFRNRKVRHRGVNSRNERNSPRGWLNGPSIMPDVYTPPLRFIWSLSASSIRPAKNAMK